MVSFDSASSLLLRECINLIQSAQIATVYMRSIPVSVFID